MPRRLLLIIPLLALGALVASFMVSSTPRPAQADVGAVGANVARFAPGTPVTITVLAEDDDGPLIIQSNLPGSTLTVINCELPSGGLVAGKCDGSGMANVTGQGTANIIIQTNSLDTDTTVDLLTVQLTLIASCTEYTVVTISADQDGNANDDLITIDCEPPTPTPTPTSTPSPTPTTTPVPPTATPVPPTATPVSQVLSSGSIQPPNTGEAGLK